MPYEKKEYDFILFVNENVKGNQPAYRGSIMVNGKPVDIVGWNKISKKGYKMITGGMSTPKKEEISQTNTEKPVKNEVPFEDNEIPF